MNFKFTSLLGAPYRGGTLLIHDNQLLAPAGNRINQVDLVESTSNTLPFENHKQIRTLAVSPDGRLLLSVDYTGRALVINRRRRALLHHISFKDTVRAAAFSPDGKYLAVAVGRLLQVWLSPGLLQKTVAPLELHRTYGQCHDNISAVDWSPDSQWIAVASKDLSARIFSLNPIEDYKPPTLAGHKEPLVAVHFATTKVGDAAELLGKERPALYTVSRDGALFAWTYHKNVNEEEEEEEEDAASEGSQEQQQHAAKRLKTDSTTPKDSQSKTYTGGHWKLTEKYFFNQRNGARLTSASFHPTGLLAVGHTNGIFDLLQLPDLSPLHTLSIGNQPLTSISFNGAGDWIAVGCAKLGQLLVWEWKSETYVIKQQGHHYDVSTCAFSPDGAYLVTGADDARVKVWTLSNNFCFVTFADHTAPVTATAFLPSGHAVLSASLDGTVRAFDLVRYRNFRTLTTPTPVQFASLAVDPGGEIVCAGSKDTFQVYVWSLRTGRLLDVLAGHEGPVTSLAFAPNNAPLLASGSWDKTIRTWDVYAAGSTGDVLLHQHDVLALAWRPDGKQLASSTLDGTIYLWDPLESELLGTISGRRDIAGGRLRTDRRTAANSTSGKCFTSLAYSADGAFLLAGGISRYVCLYDVQEKVMLRRFQISHNRSLDGVVDMLNSKRMTDAGALEQIDAASDSDDDDDNSGNGNGDQLLLPPSGAGGASGADALPGTGGGGARVPIIRTRCVALSPTGRSWAAATTEGVLHYSLDDSLLFDPTDLTEDVTPAAALTALRRGAYLTAVLLALRLRDPKLVQHIVLSVPLKAVPVVVNSLPATAAPGMLETLAQLVPSSPHLEFLLKWVRALGLRHGVMLQQQQQQQYMRHGGGGNNGRAAAAAAATPALRALQKTLTKVHEDLAAMCESNVYSLEYITNVPS
jgi:periodic tryptophan protein 2